MPGRMSNVDSHFNCVQPAVPFYFPINLHKIAPMIYCYESPVGFLSYAFDGNNCSHLWLDHRGVIKHDDPVSVWLDAYFQGRILPLPDVAKPGTIFQGKLRHELSAISFAQTITYGELAATLQTSPRALGQALAANPLPILFPCHRVLAANGLGGFAFGLTWKKRLLRFEHDSI